MPAHHRQNDFESFSLRPLRYFSVYVNPGFPEVDAYSVLLEFPLELGGQTNRRIPKKRAVPRHPKPSVSQVPAGFRVRPVMTTSIRFPLCQLRFPGVRRIFGFVRIPAKAGCRCGPAVTNEATRIPAAGRYGAPLL